MESLYKKIKGKYVDAGYIGAPELYDGVWLVQKRKYSKSTSSLIWKLGDIPMADVNLHVSIMKHEDELVSYLMKLKDIDSDEYKEAANLSGHINGPLEFYNWSANDFILFLLRKLGQLVQEEKETFTFTNRESFKNRKEKLLSIKKRVQIKSILDKIKSKTEDELIEELYDVDVDVLDNLLLNLNK